MNAVMRSRHVGRSEIERLKRLREEYTATIGPFIRIKTKIMGICLTKITLFPDGHIEHEYTEQGKRIMDECDKNILAIGERLKAEVTP